MTSSSGSDSGSGSGSDSGSGSGESGSKPMYDDIIVNTLELNATITGLTPFTEYSCYTSATTSIGEGNFSDAILETTDEYSKTILIE